MDGLDIELVIEPDITDLVMRHHAEIRRILRAVARDTVSPQTVDAAVATLEAHEHAKSGTLYELAVDWLDDGSAVALGHRRRAETLLEGAARLQASTRNSGRGGGGAGLAGAFVEHARADEHGIIAPLRHRCPRDRLLEAARRYDSLVGPPLSRSADVTC